MSILSFFQVCVVAAQMLISGYLINSQAGTDIQLLLALVVTIFHVLMRINDEDLICVIYYGPLTGCLACIIYYLHLIGVQLPAKGGGFFAVEDALGLSYALMTFAVSCLILFGIKFMLQKR